MLEVVGVSHHTAPVDVRERFAFSPAQAAEALRALRAGSAVDEAVLLSTCNRTELYLRGQPERAAAAARELLFERAAAARKAAREAAPDAAGEPGQTESGETEAGEGILYRARGVEVARHLFRVTSGLDSLVLGEAEIQGQVREAYERADPGPVLHRLFQMALGVGGRVRAETRLGHGAASVASVAVELARKVFGDLRRKRVVVVGAGETGELVVQALERHGVTDVTVVNRTFERAEELARRLDGRARPWEELLDAVAATDVLVTSTGSMEPVVRAAELRERLRREASHPLLVLDLAIPRDVEAGASEQPQVFLYNVDDLARLVDETLDRRSVAVERAERLVEEQAEEFRSWLAAQDVVPVIRSLRGRAERVRRREIERLLRRLEHLPEEDREHLEEFSRRLVAKMLHRPTTRLREGAANGVGGALVEAVRYLYGDRAKSDDRATERKETDDESQEEAGKG